MIKTPIPIFRAEPANNEMGFRFINPDQVRRYVGTLKGIFDVTIKIARRKRTLSQNAYYWIILKILEEHTGHRDEELHEIFKLKFLGASPIRYRSSQVYMIAPSTTKLTTKDFARYIDLIIQEAAEMGVAIPSPDKVTLS